MSVEAISLPPALPVSSVEDGMSRAVYLKKKDVWRKLTEAAFSMFLILSPDAPVASPPTPVPCTGECDARTRNILYRYPDARWIENSIFTGYEYNNTRCAYGKLREVRYDDCVPSRGSKGRRPWRPIRNRG
ncbi:MAG: hypothetical protein M3Q44_08000 [bacterium]|nr:hypothetical protein [bacterium]